MSARGTPCFSMPCLFVLTVLLPTLALSARVTHFNVVHANTGKVIRRLNDNDVLSFPHPIALVAVAPGARVVTFSSPWHVVDNTAPTFSFPREQNAGKLGELRIGKGLKTLRAFADWRPAQALSVKFEVLRFVKGGDVFKPPLPAVGPKPWEVVPDFEKGVKKVPVPALKPACKKTVPSISDVNVGRSYWQYGDAQINFKVDWCAGDNPLRVRVLSYDHVRNWRGMYKVKTTVLGSASKDYFQYGSNFLLSTKCQAMNIFIEACGQRPGAVRPVCATSGLHSVFAFPVIEPVLLSHPPSLLRLAPGDKAVMKYRIKQGAKSFGHGTASYRLQVAAVSRTGNWLGQSKWATGSEVSARIPLVRPWLGVKPWEYDGAQVFLRFSYQSCPGNIATIREREATNVTVSNATARLVRQDDKLPVLEKLVFPPTVIGKPVSISVKARNPGNGRRAGWTPTRLTYQWYIRERDFGFQPQFPAKLEGETRASLRFPKAECEMRSCGRHGCFRMRVYHVEVCNTLGCVSSNTVTPDILPPPLGPDEEWDRYSCMVVKKSA